MGAKAWVVRGGREGEYEEFALDNDVVVSGWSEIGDLSDTKDRNEFREIIENLNRDMSTRAIASHTGQLLRFVREIKDGDLIIMPRKTTKAFALGRCMGEYEYKPEKSRKAPHIRHVKWIRTEVPRSSVEEKLRNSLDSAMTVFEVKRDNAPARLETLANTGKDPGPPSITDDVSPTFEEPDSIDEESQAQVDIEQLAKDRIGARIAQEFKEHELAKLVEDILRAEGYFTSLSPPGPDGGVDVLVGSGPLGLESPRIAVQVKSGQDPVNEPTLRGLQGAKANFDAETALFVAWNGFNQAARRLARNQWFSIRIWDSGDLIEKITENYNQLSEDIRAQLPLKQIWTLADEDQHTDGDPR